MRPCDDTFGLVRGNRRKAVFAFKGLFSEGRSSRFRFWQWVFTAYFGSAGKIETCRAHSDFCQQNRRSRESKTGAWSPDLGLPRTSGIARRKYAANSGTPEHNGFSHKGSAGRSIVAFRSARHARDLPHTSEFWPSTLCSRCGKHLIDAI